MSKAPAIFVQKRQSAASDASATPSVGGKPVLVTRAKNVVAEIDRNDVGEFH